MWLVLFALLIGVYFIAAKIAEKYTTTDPPSLSSIPERFKSILDVPASQAPTLSIVVPCYNEEDRLKPMLEDTFKFCEAHVKQSDRTFSDYEVIVVDDCSKDKTRDVAENFFKAHPEAKMRLVRVIPNHGKGYAVRTGFFNALGDYVLMADGDNATKIDDTAKLFKSIQKTSDSKKPFCVAIGSRAHLEDDSIAQRTLSRTILMKIFHLVVAVTYAMGTFSICQLHDTQCGFKLFDRRKCLPVFRSNRLERWAFDVELLIHCKRLNLQVCEVPITWQEIAGSKVNVKGMVQMGLECILMCVVYPLGIWRTK